MLVRIEGELEWGLVFVGRIGEIRLLKELEEAIGYYCQAVVPKAVS